jgi:hypothetical protein
VGIFIVPGFEVCCLDDFRTRAGELLLNVDAQF